jgi:hypothetical protein
MTFICGLVPLLGVTIIHLADRRDLFENSNLVKGGNCKDSAQQLRGDRDRQKDRERQFRLCIVS